MGTMCEKTGSKVLKPSLRADESGLALIYVTLALPVIIGFALLAIDVGRFSTLNSSLQHGADALALAGAAELDGRNDAITRSENAMQQFVTQNTALFTSSTATIKWADVTTCYLSSIPASDSTPISSSSCLDKTAVAASSEAAKFVQVVVTPKTYTTIFPVSFLGALSNTTQTGAQAVAGFQAAVCNFTPMFMCNPFETTITSTLDDHGLFDFVKDPTKRRAAIRFLAVATGQTTTATPGQYGFLDPLTGNGKKTLGNEIASVSPDLCYIRNKVDTKTGDMTDLRNAFNTRFDLYFGSYKKTDYPPAGNVRKGYIIAKQNGNGNYSAGNACNSTDTNLAQNPNAFLGLPVDDCFKDNSCASKNSSGSSLVGNGNWNWDPDLPSTLSSVSFTKYWDTNFRAGATQVPYPTYGDLGLGNGTNDSTQYTNLDPPPRYDIYKYENTKVVSQLLRTYKTNSNATPPAGGVNYGNNSLGETGVPQCASSGIDSPDRRIIYGAIVNCGAENLVPGNGGYTAFAFGKFFMIRPIQSTPNSDLWLELVDIVRPGDGTGVARDMVQLYR